MIDEPTQATSLEKPSDLGSTPEAVARRWKLELRLASKRERAWRNKAKAIYDLYAPESPAVNSFNILWTNTETLRQSVYNSQPQPEVRRRYQDADPLGKAVSDVLVRALEFSQDTYDEDAVIKGDVLAMLLPGRAVSRVRYIPDIRSMGGADSKQDDSQESDSYEEIVWEQVICERVQYDDFHILCAAKTWDEVSAIGFKHRFTREDCVEKFGEKIGNAVPLDEADDEDVKKSKDTQDLFKTAEVWEIWDKDEKQVVWICPTYAKPCKIQDDPLELGGFFPIPRPLYAIENDQTLVPSALYTQYEQQAKELNKISARINKIIDALKVRGVYDATLSELGELMKATDNDLVPISNATAWLEKGGIEKAIWFMPIDVAANVLKVLYEQREATKQVIYEITGISDIMRAASDPNETFGAQKIKTQWGTQRLQRMQQEVQRYIRDLIRLKAEIIAEKFQPETFEQMTLVQLPHQSDVDQANAQAMQQYQAQVAQMQQQPPQPGQPAPQLPPPPQPQNPVTWEAVIDAMKGDKKRTYRVDIETDSTLAATQDSDMEGLRNTLTAVTQLIEGFGPAVQAGAMPAEAVKEIMLTVVRRAKMGNAVEDALDKMQAPKPPPDPNAGQAQIEMQKMQATAQLEQMKAQMADQQHQREVAANMQMEQHKQEMQAAQVQHQNQLEAQRELERQQLEAAAEERKQQLEAEASARQIEFDRWKAELEASTKITVAQIAAQSKMDNTLLSAEQAADTEVSEELTDDQPKLSDLMGMMQQMMAHITSPKTIERGQDGRAVAVGGRPVVRGPDGRISGIQ